MKMWVLGSTAGMIGLVAMSACSSNSGTGTGTAGSTTHATTTTTHATTTTSGTGGSGGTGGSTSTDPICNDPNAQPSNACTTCINTQIMGQTACIKSFVTQCEGDKGCTAYLNCQNGCVEHAQDAGANGAGGGSTACIAGEATGDAGTTEDNCVACCQNSNTAGTNTFFSDLIDSCVCASGAPCATACAN